MVQRPTQAGVNAATMAASDSGQLFQGSDGQSSARPSDNLYVQGLPGDLSEQKLKEVFGKYGTVIRCRVLPHTGQGKCSALIRYADVEQATWMVNNINGNVPEGFKEPVSVRFADTPESKAQREKARQEAAKTRAAELHNAPPSEKLYVSKLPPRSEQDAVKVLFGPFGEITYCKVVGEDRSAAVVRFKTVEQAKAAIDGMNGIKPEGYTSPVEVSFADTPELQLQRTGMMNIIVNGFAAVGALPGGRWQNNDNAVYVAGLPPDTEDLHLYRLFACFGPIAPKGVRAMMNPDGTCKGIGFVNFLDEESAQAAINTYNGAVLPDGTMLKVAIKKSR